MADPLYGGGEMFFLDSPIKQEPGNQMDSQGMNMSHGMPIPSRRTGRTGMSDFGYDLDEALALGALPSLGNGTVNLNASQTCESLGWLLQPQDL
jgi:hypothetical protein